MPHDRARLRPTSQRSPNSTEYTQYSSIEFSYVHPCSCRSPSLLTDPPFEVGPTERADSAPVQITYICFLLILTKLRW